jgi:hypothetical protein
VLFLPFEQLSGQQIVQLQDSILECLHHHTLLAFNKIFEDHRGQTLSCFGLGLSIWFTAQLMFLTFQLFSQFFSQCFEHNLNYYILQLHVSLDV